MLETTLVNATINAVMDMATTGHFFPNENNNKKNTNKWKWHAQTMKI